jgi:hypothetical protein
VIESTTRSHDWFARADEVTEVKELIADLLDATGLVPAGRPV